MKSSAFEDIEKLSPGDHLCCIYEREEEHRQVVTLFVRLGLERNQRVIYIVDLHTAETVMDYLRADGVDIDAYRESGQFVILTRHETYTREDEFDPDAMIGLLKSETEKSLGKGYAALRVTGEMTWALTGLPGTERLIEYENKLNRFMPEHACMTICQYDKREFSPAVLLDVLRTHPHAIIGTEMYENFYYLSPEALLGEKPKESELELWIDNLREYSIAEQSLLESQERYKNLYNSIRDAILVADTDRRITHCNQAFTDLFGYSLEEVEGEKTSSVYAEKEEFENLGRRLEKFDHDEILFTIHYRKKNGEVFPGETKVFTLKDDKDEVVGYIGLIRDITEKMRVERDLQREQRYVNAVLESSGALIVIIDGEGNILRMNSSCEKITGYSEEELRNISLWSLIPQEEREGVSEVFEELMRGSYPNTFENHWITKSGEKRFIAWTNTVVERKDGGVESIISTGIDITERKREMESRVEKLQEEIARMESFSSPGTTSVTGRMYAQRDFLERSPEDFQEMRQEYQDILSDRLEERIYKTDNRISARLNGLAERFGMATAGPKDVVEIHVQALKNLNQGVPYKRAQALTEEGRLLAIELMGYLVSFYRNQISSESGRKS